MDQLYANGELSLCYGFGEGSIDDKIRQGLFPNTTRVYPWKNGSIKNSNYLGIHYNASNKAGAMVVINYMISPEAQLRKIDPSGMDANTVLDIDKLTDDWKVKFENREKRKYGATIEELATYAIQEPDPQYMIRLYGDFRKEVIEK
jgi:putative spermidine/putrescine transport system substrate-binding protein